MRKHDYALLALAALLEGESWDALAKAVARPPARGLQLKAIDGRVFDATVSAVPGGVAVFCYSFGKIGFESKEKVGPIFVVSCE